MDEELRELEGAAQKTARVAVTSARYLSEIVELFLSHRPDLGHIGRKQSRQPDLPVTASKDNPPVQFSFTGKDTDLSYFYHADKMPLSAIENIGDESLKEQVVNTFDKLAYDEIVKVEEDMIHTTEKGEKILEDPAFRKRAAADQQEAFASKIAGMNYSEGQQAAVLSGNYVDDFSYFRHSDSLDLRAVIQTPNQEISQQVIQNIKGWEKSGMVEIKNRAAVITEKGKQMLQSKEFRQIAHDVPAAAISSLKQSSKAILVPLQSKVAQVLNPVKAIPLPKR